LLSQAVAQTLKKKAFGALLERKSACVSALVCYFSRRSLTRGSAADKNHASKSPQAVSTEDKLSAVYGVMSAEMPKATRPGQFQPIDQAAAAPRAMNSTLEE